MMKSDRNTLIFLGSNLYITIMQRLILFIFHLLYLFKITIYNFQFFFDFESHLRYHEE